MTPSAARQRRAIDISGFSHRNPIPAAARVGPLLASSMVIGYRPGTRDVPESVSEQVANLFSYVGAILSGAGADWSDIVRMIFYVPSLDMRPEINVAWIAHYPEEATRPARITHQMPTELGVRCEFLAYVTTPDGSGQC